jgi:Dihydrodipicolinate synthetase family
MSLSDQLGGTGVALVTPFTAAAGVDFDALGGLIDFVIEGGVDYLVTLGTTGETATLTGNEKKDIIQFTYDKAAGRVPVVVGIGGNNTQEVVNDLQTYPLDRAVAANHPRKEFFSTTKHWLRHLPNQSYCTMCRGARPATSLPELRCGWHSCPILPVLKKPAAIWCSACIYSGTGLLIFWLPVVMII